MKINKKTSRYTNVRIRCYGEIETRVMITYQPWSKMLFMFNDKWLVDMYVNLLLASLNKMLIAEVTRSGPTENARTLSRRICSYRDVPPDAIFGLYELTLRL